MSSDVHQRGSKVNTSLDHGLDQSLSLVAIEVSMHATIPVAEQVVPNRGVKVRRNLHRFSHRIFQNSISMFDAVQSCLDGQKRSGGPTINLWTGVPVDQ
jgi:hypothetical protein